jgi:hypothetical protein
MTRNSGKLILGRGLLALFGSYALAALWGAVLARMLPIPRLDATLIATILSFAIFAGVAVYVFAARSLRSALAGLGVTGIAGFILLRVAGL